MRCLRKGVAIDSLLGVCVVVHHGLHVHHHDHEEVAEGLEEILDVAQLLTITSGGGCRPGLDLPALPIVNNKALFTTLHPFEEFMLGGGGDDVA